MLSTPGITMGLGFIGSPFPLKRSASNSHACSYSDLMLRITYNAIVGPYTYTGISRSNLPVQTRARRDLLGIDFAFTHQPYIRPMTSSTTTTSNTAPKPPLGA